MLLLLFVACHQDLPDTGAGKGSNGTDALPSLSLVLAAPSTPAGTAVGYTVSLVWPDGTTQTAADAGLDVVLSSDLEALRWDETTLTPILAEDHTITASVSWAESTLSDTAKIDVDPGAVASLDLDLAASQTPAGEPLAYTVTGIDAWGNAVDTLGATVTSDAGTISIVPEAVAGTIAGVYTVTATLDGVSDAETFRIVAGPAATLDLSLSDTDLEVYDTTVATAIALDVYENPIEVDPTVWTEGTGSFAQWGTAFTYYSEGEYWVYAEVDGLSAAYGPIHIDSTGPVLTITTPEHGAWWTSGSGTVAGTVEDTASGVTSLSLNGDAVSVATDGSFSTTYTADFGLNVLETSAIDGDDNVTTDVRALLDGSFLSLGTPVGDALAVRINEEGFDSIEAIGEELIAGIDLASLLPNPAASMEEENCYDIIFDEVCVTWYSVTLYLSNVTIGSTDLNLDPKAAGYIEASFTVYDPSIDWAADGDVIGIGYSGDGVIYADSITITMQLQPSVSGGVLSLNVLSADASSSGFTFDWDSWLYDVMDFFGLDLSSTVQGYMEDALESMLMDEVPAMLGDTLSSLALSTSFDIQGGTYTLNATPYSAAVDEVGMTLGMQTTFTPSTWVHDSYGLGSLYGAYALPSYADGSPGMEVSLSADFLNQALYALWGGGLLDQDLGADALGLDLSSLGDFLPFESLAITLDPLLPPVVVPSTSGAMFDLQIGDMLLTLSDPSTGSVILQVYLSAVTSMDLAITDGLLAPTLGEFDLSYDVVVPANNTAASADTEALLAALMPYLLPSLTSALSTIPIPELSGFGFTIAAIEADGGYVTIGGDLESLDLSF